MGITLLENMFITQYLPYVSENELKVYIYGLKFASEGYCHFEDFDNKKFAEILGLTQEEVEDAWNYWIDKKLVNRKNEDGNVYYEFNSLIDMFVSDFTGIENENDEYVEGDLYDKNSFESGKYNKRFKDAILRVEEFIGTKLNYKELLEFKDYFSMYPDHDVELLPEAFKKSKRHNGGAYVLCGARSVIGVDTGLLHLANALDKPLIGIYTDSDPVKTGVQPSAWAENMGGIGCPPRPEEVFERLLLLEQAYQDSRKVFR